MKMTRDQYLDRREFFRLQGVREEKQGNIEKAEYFAGIVRGLDLAFGEGSTDREVFRKYWLDSPR